MKLSLWRLCVCLWLSVYVVSCRAFSLHADSKVKHESFLRTRTSSTSTTCGQYLSKFRDLALAPGLLTSEESVSLTSETVMAAVLSKLCGVHHATPVDDDCAAAQNVLSKATAQGLCYSDRAIKLLRNTQAQPLVTTAEDRKTPYWASTKHITYSFEREGSATDQGLVESLMSVYGPGVGVDGSVCALVWLDMSSPCREDYFQEFRLANTLPSPEDLVSSRFANVNDNGIKVPLWQKLPSVQTSMPWLSFFLEDEIGESWEVKMSSHVDSASTVVTYASTLETALNDAPDDFSNDHFHLVLRFPAKKTQREMLFCLAVVLSDALFFAKYEQAVFNHLWTPFTHSQVSFLYNNAPSNHWRHDIYAGPYAGVALHMKNHPLGLRFGDHIYGDSSLIGFEFRSGYDTAAETASLLTAVSAILADERKLEQVYNDFSAYYQGRAEFSEETFASSHAGLNDLIVKSIDKLSTFYKKLSALQSRVMPIDGLPFVMYILFSGASQAPASPKLLQDFLAAFPEEGTWDVSSFSTMHTFMASKQAAACQDLIDVKLVAYTTGKSKSFLDRIKEIAA